MSRGWIGKENRRYLVESAECRTADCAVAAAVTCASGFGPQFVVAADARRSLVEVDPIWWLTTYYPPTRELPPCNPFKTDALCNPNTYTHGYCNSIGSNPGSLYASIERAGEQCCYWSEQAEKIYTNGTFKPIDCADGPEEWFCLAYCSPPTFEATTSTPLPSAPQVR